MNQDTVLHIAMIMMKIGFAFMALGLLIIVAAVLYGIEP